MYILAIITYYSLLFFLEKEYFGMRILSMLYSERSNVHITRKMLKQHAILNEVYVTAN